jgi:hypothetical protein
MIRRTVLNRFDSLTSAWAAARQHGAEASEREAQTDPCRQKVILRLVYNIVSDV